MMSRKTKRRLLQLVGLLTGLIFGLVRPQQIQQMYPILGIGVGIGYFILIGIASDKERSLDDVSWFIPVQMLMYFVIGGAVSSTIVLMIELYTN